MRLRRFAAAGAVLAAVVLPAAPASAAPAPLIVAQPSANGHGTTINADGSKRQFSFSAVTRKDGTVTGSAVLHNPAFDFFAKFDVSCLKVEGNRATFGGLVTKTNDPFFSSDGGGFDRGFFTVVDNGEPGTGDTISSVFFDNEVGPEACELTGSEEFPQRPIENGNVQVKSG